MEDGYLKIDTKNFAETTPYDSFEGLVEFITTERQPIDYALLVRPDTQVLALGESHLDYTTKKEVENCLTQLKEKGVTHFGLEFFGIEMQPILDAYAKTRNENDKKVLMKHLETYSKKDANLYLNVVEKAFFLGIRVVGLDIPQKEKNHYETSQKIELQQIRNPFMAQKIEAILSENKKYKIVTFSGSGHIGNIDEGSGSMVVNLRSRNINVVTVNLSGRLKKPFYQGPEISVCTQQAGVTMEKFMLPAQVRFPDLCLPFDWIIHIPESSNRDNITK